MNILNSLEHMGYKVVTSGAFTGGQAVFDRCLLVAVSILCESFKGGKAFSTGACHHVVVHSFSTCT